MQAVTPVLVDVEWRERTGLEDAVRKDLLGLEEETWRLQTIKYLQVRLWQTLGIFPFSIAADISISASLSTAVTTKETVKSTEGSNTACLLQMLFWQACLAVHTHLFWRRQWISWWNTTKSVGSRTAGFSSQKIPLCCRCLCTGLWEYCWHWYSSAFWARYILCPHQVNNQACILQQWKQKRKKGRKSSSSAYMGEEVVMNTSENGQRSTTFSSSYHHLKWFKL